MWVSWVHVRWSNLDVCQHALHPQTTHPPKRAPVAGKIWVRKVVDTHKSLRRLTLGHSGCLCRSSSVSVGGLLLTALENDAFAIVTLKTVPAPTNISTTKSLCAAPIAHTQGCRVELFGKPPFPLLPFPGQPTPGVVKQDKSSGDSVDTTKTRSGPDEQWREANRRRQRQPIRYRGLVPTPPPPSSRLIHPCAVPSARSKDRTPGLGWCGDGWGIPVQLHALWGGTHQVAFPTLFTVGGSN